MKHTVGAEVDAGRPGSDVAAANVASTVYGMERQAPWLDDEDSWRISEEAAAALRPGWWCHTREQMSFVEIKGVAHIPTSQGRTVFVDLADGRTLALDETTSVFVRRQL